MLKIDLSVKGHELEKQFNIEPNENTPKIWNDTQDSINSAIRKQIDAKDEGEQTFDCTEALDIFFKAFDTQALQDQALLQFVVRDIQDRVSHMANPPSSALEELLRGSLEEFISKKQEEEEDDLL